MSVRSRLEKSMMAGAVAGIAVTLAEERQRLAGRAAAARLAAHGQHPPGTAALAAGFAVTMLLAGLAVFTLATMYARWRRGRAYAAATRRRGWRENGDEYGGWW